MSALREDTRWDDDVGRVGLQPGRRLRQGAVLKVYTPYGSCHAAVKQGWFGAPRRPGRRRVRWASGRSRRECLLPLKVDPITFVQQHNLGVPELNNHRALCDRLDRLYRYRLQTSGAPRPHMTHPCSHRQHTTFTPAEPARPGRGWGRGAGRRSGRSADGGRSVPRPPRVGERDRRDL